MVARALQALPANRPPAVLLLASRLRAPARVGCASSCFDAATFYATARAHGPERARDAAAARLLKQSLTMDMMREAKAESNPFAEWSSASTSTERATSAESSRSRAQEHSQGSRESAPTRSGPEPPPNVRWAKVHSESDDPASDGKRRSGRQPGPPLKVSSTTLGVSSQAIQYMSETLGFIPSLEPDPSTGPSSVYQSGHTLLPDAPNFPKPPPSTQVKEEVEKISQAGLVPKSQSASSSASSFWELDKDPVARADRGLEKFRQRGRTKPDTEPVIEIIDNPIYENPSPQKAEDESNYSRRKIKQAELAAQLRARLKKALEILDQEALQPPPPPRPNPDVSPSATGEEQQSSGSDTDLEAFERKFRMLVRGPGDAFQPAAAPRPNPDVSPPATGEEEESPGAEVEFERKFSTLVREPESTRSKMSAMAQAPPSLGSLRDSAESVGGMKVRPATRLQTVKANREITEELFLVDDSHHGPSDVHIPIPLLPPEIQAMYAHESYLQFGRVDGPGSPVGLLPLPPVRDLVLAHELFGVYWPVQQWTRTEYIRDDPKSATIAIAGHAETGKTPLIEALGNVSRALCRPYEGWNKFPELIAKVPTGSAPISTAHSFVPLAAHKWDRPFRDGPLRLIEAPSWGHWHQKKPILPPYGTMLRKRKSIRGVVVTVNALTGLHSTDRELFEILARLEMPFIVVLGEAHPFIPDTQNPSDQFPPQFWNRLVGTAQSIIELAESCGADRWLKGVFPTGSNAVHPAQVGYLGVKYAIARMAGFVSEEAWSRRCLGGGAAVSEFGVIRPPPLAPEHFPITRSIDDGTCELPTEIMSRDEVNLHHPIERFRKQAAQGKFPGHENDDETTRVSRSTRVLRLEERRRKVEYMLISGGQVRVAERNKKMLSVLESPDDRQLAREILQLDSPTGERRLPMHLMKEVIETVKRQAATSRRRAARW